MNIMNKILPVLFLVGMSLATQAVLAQSTAQMNLVFSTERASMTAGFNEVDVIMTAGIGYVSNSSIFVPNTTNPDGSFTAINFRFTQAGAGPPLLNTDFIVTSPTSGITAGSVTNLTAGGCYPAQPAFNISIARSAGAVDASATPTVIATLRYPNTNGPQTLTVRNTTTQACASRESFWSNTHPSNSSTRLTILGNSVVLPIELLFFQAHTRDCNLSLHWETATEKNFAYYQIEASKDGGRFVPIGQVKPQSLHSTEKRVYKYTVATAYHGYCFRLKSVDLDGSFQYSDVVYEESPCEKTYSMHAYPNPSFQSELTIEVSSPREHEQVRWLLLDGFGKRILEQTTDLKTGVNKLQIPTDQLPSGTYFIQILGVEQLSQPLKFVRSNF
jgi:hypothetical protein